MIAVMKPEMASVDFWPSQLSKSNGHRMLLCPFNHDFCSVSLQPVCDEFISFSTSNPTLQTRLDYCQ